MTTVPLFLKKLEETNYIRTCINITGNILFM